MANKDGSDFIPIISNLSYLKMRLDERFRAILPDLLLFDIDMAYIQYNDRRNSYLYTICALLLDCQSNEIELYSTHDGLEHKDSQEWNLLKNSDAEYKGGMYLCKCFSGILLYYGIDRLDVTIISLEKLTLSK
jgi:hypothetical protein